jgi:signal transduction histidine kinase
MSITSTKLSEAAKPARTLDDQLQSSDLVTSRFSAQELVAVRAQARESANLAGLEGVKQIQFATAVSEIARNAVQYATAGVITFSIVRRPDTPGGALVAQVSDDGPGIRDLDSVLAGTRGLGGYPTGITGSRRLVDHLSIECPPRGGTCVRLEMMLPRTAQWLDSRGSTNRLVPQTVVTEPLSALEESNRQNRELLRTLHELRENQAALEKADEMKNQFITTLAHELRSPLSTLHMSLDLLQRVPKAAPEAQLARLAVMARQASQMTKLVDDLMDVARVGQGKVHITKLPVDVNTLVTHAVEMTSANVAAKPHSISVELCSRPLWISGDKQRLTQVLNNLIQNAASYTRPGGAIAVKIGQQDENAVIEVRDNGIGISSEVLPHIFGLFVQGGGHESSEGGLGLGLSLVQHLTRSHGGTVTATSEGLGKGSSFVVRLPLISAPSA